MNQAKDELQCEFEHCIWSITGPGTGFRFNQTGSGSVSVPGPTHSLVKFGTWACPVRHPSFSVPRAVRCKCNLCFCYQV